MKLPHHTNYSTNAFRVDLGNVTLWFSYATLVAFKPAGGDLVIRENDWGTTTGKFLNAIDGGNKTGRITGDEFARKWAEFADKKLT